MNFVANRSSNTMSIDNAPLQFAVDALLQPNEELVIWSGDATAGRIEYDDQLRVMENFRDLLGYAPLPRLINQWLTTAAVSSPALTLDQAKFVKTNIVADICRSKQRLSYRLLNRNFDVDDEMVIQVMMAMLPMIFGGSGGGGGGLVSQINTSLNNVMYHFQTISSHFNDYVITPASSAHSNWNSLLASGGPIGTGAGGMGAPSITGWTNAAVPGGVSLLSCSTIAVGNYIPWVGGPSEMSTPSVPWESADTMSNIQLTGSQVKDLMFAITARNADLSKTKMNKIRQINALSLIESVIDHDIAAGW